MERERKTIEELGEFGLIEYLTKNLQILNKETVKGVGDDAAILDYGNSLIAVTSDILMEGIHFNLIYTPLKHLGYKAVAVNLSDIYAMNATPKQVIVSIAFSSKFTLEQIDSIYSGIKLACNNYGVDLAGGDTSTSLTGLAISITALGKANKEKISYRSGANKNDIICVSGNLGAAYLGLQILEREKKIFLDNPGAQPNFEGYDYLLERQLKPEPRADIINFFDKEEIRPTSMIDISDGLSSELLHICKESGVGCKLFASHIPFHQETEKMASEFNISPVVAALNGGEDYELLFTVPPSELGKIKDNKNITMIGHISDKEAGCNLVTDDGAFLELTAHGWNALNKQ